MKRTLTDFFRKPAKVTNNPGVGDVVNVDPPAEKKSYSFRREWLKDFEWLRYVDGSMHCVHCKACGTEFAGNTAFALESTHFKRESLVKHGESAKHKKCRDKCVANKSGSSGSIIKAFNRQDAAGRSTQLAELNVKFNTAYTIAKEELAFTKFKPMLQLMKKNGVAINMTYANDKSCANIIGVIADTIRENNAIKVSSAQYISFIIDGDTDLSVKECVIVYVRILLDGQPTNILVGHVEVEHANADGEDVLLLLLLIIQSLFSII